MLVGDRKKCALKPVVAAPVAVRVLDSKQLFHEARTVHIDHGGERYILRITRENKLILTK